jgi:hypothetical protein
MAERIGFDFLRDALQQQQSGNATTTSIDECRHAAMEQTDNTTTSAGVPGCFPVLQCYARREVTTLSAVAGLAEALLVIALDQLEEGLAGTLVESYLTAMRPYVTFSAWEGSHSPQLIALVVLEVLSFLAVVRLLLHPPYLGVPRPKSVCRGCCGCECCPQGCCLNPLCGCRYKKCGDDALAMFGDDDGTTEAAAEVSCVWAKYRATRCWCDADDEDRSAIARNRARFSRRPVARCIFQWWRGINIACPSIVMLILALASVLAITAFGVDDDADQFDGALWIELNIASTAWTFLGLLVFVALNSAVEAAMNACGSCWCMLRACVAKIPAEKATVSVESTSRSTAPENGNDDDASAATATVVGADASADDSDASNESDATSSSSDFADDLSVSEDSSSSAGETEASSSSDSTTTATDDLEDII